MLEMHTEHQQNSLSFVLDVKSISDAAKGLAPARDPCAHPFAETMVLVTSLNKMAAPQGGDHDESCSVSHELNRVLGSTAQGSSRPRLMLRRKKD